MAKVVVANIKRGKSYSVKNIPKGLLQQPNIPLFFVLKHAFIFLDACRVIKKREHDSDENLWYVKNINEKYSLKQHDPFEDISRINVIASILENLKEKLEHRFGQINSVVITFPIFEDDEKLSDHRKTIAEAAKLVKFEQVRLEREVNVVFSLFYNLPTPVQVNTGLFVLKIGAGSCWASVSRFIDGIELLKKGNPSLGGEDFTNLLINHYLKELQQYNKKVYDDKKRIKIMRNTCEKAKIDLSFFDETKYALLNIF